MYTSNSNQYDVNHLKQVQENLRGITYSVNIDKSDFSSTVEYRYDPLEEYSKEKLKEIIDNLHQLLQIEKEFDALKTGHAFTYICPPNDGKPYFYNLNWKFPAFSNH